MTARDLCWCDTDTCRVDLRIFAGARAAALAAGDDAGVLAHAAAAVECYQGDLLPGVYDLWVLDARSELDRQCADLCDLLGAARARAGDLPGAAQAARRRIQLQPLEEIGYRDLMLLQADLGDLAGAVSTYHHCASVLERELGVIPGPVTRQAFQRLIASGAGTARAGRGPALPFRRRGGSASRAVTGARPARAAMAERRFGNPWAGNDPRRGRRGEEQNRGRIASMAGLHGAVVASSQCFGMSGRLALAPVADWLRHPAVMAASAAIDPVWRAELGRLLPAGGREERGAGPRAMADSWQGHRFFEGLARALMAVGRPTLLVLDNMQWCDQETLSFITFFLGLVADTPALVVGTWRDDAFDDDPELAAWTVRMRATGLLTELSLSPLDAAGTARLAEAISGRPLPQPDADLLAATTGGFPLYIVEAMRGRDDADRDPVPAGTSRPCCEPAGAGVRPPARWPAWRRRWARTSPSTCLPRRVTWTPGRGGGRRRTVAAPDHARVPRRLRLLPRPAPRDRLRAGKPAEAVAVAPADGAGPRAFSFRRRGRRLGAARRAVCPRRAARTGGHLLPPGGRRGRG